MPALMVQGCTSWSGKSWLATGLCRWFARRGVLVAPFKAQNMSNNARVVDGGEIGVAQWLQARAAGITPDVRMNPVLVKPTATSSQVIRLGRVDPALTATPWTRRAPRLWDTVTDAYDRLHADVDLVVIEGAGSPAETNLATSDLANMRMAGHADAPVLLVVDIDRGGAFAHLYGTWRLVGADRRRIAGFVLNRFRGDPALLGDGPADLQARTGVPTVGVVPMLDHDLPDEDGARWRGVRGEPAPASDGRRRVGIVCYPRASNLDEFARIEQVADLVAVTSPSGLAGCDLVVLPGSKDVHADRTWLAATGLDAAIRTAAASTRTVGICAGLQLLGERIEDPAGVETHPGTRTAGLGLLPLVTTFAPDKVTGSVTVTFARKLPEPWQPLGGLRAGGYEIRHGRTHLDEASSRHVRPPLAVIDGDRGWVCGNVLGVTVHGLLEDDDVLEALVGARPQRTLDDTFDLLADSIDTHLDTDLLTDLARTP
jgi:adenosylcobyric acid synthase